MIVLFTFIGCSWVGPTAYQENVQDSDGDGAVSDRFGGPDCRDDDPQILDGIVAVENIGIQQCLLFPQILLLPNNLQSSQLLVLSLLVQALSHYPALPSLARLFWRRMSGQNQ